MTYTNVDQAPSIYQWDPSSRHPLPDPGNAASNCGPTGVTFIANFFRDASFGINQTRQLAGIANYRGTSIAEQRTMLAKRGVPCYAAQPTVATMRELVASGRRPIMVGLHMARVPEAMRGHPFTGMHTVVLRRTRTVGGVRGFDVLDPNFSKLTGRVDPTGGHRWYSESVVNAAFWEATLGTRSWALVPTNPKVIVAPTQYVQFNAGVDGVNLRTGPDQTKRNVYAIAYADADPKPNGIIRQPAYGGGTTKWIGNTGARRTLHGVVKGPDGHTYNKLRLSGTDRYQYVQSRFMHRV